MISTPRFIILQVVEKSIPHDEAVSKLAEAESLITTFGGSVIIKEIQHSDHPHGDTYIGPGKVEWLANVVRDEKIQVVLLNDIVGSGQLFRLEKALWSVNTKIQVWDRVDLILNIFEQHATSKAAKLQIELARIDHIGPRIYGLGGTVLSRQGGGIGTRGAGETNTEMERQKIKKIKQKITKQLERYADEQTRRMDRRKMLGISTVALVGYTSAGKTTLFNALTSKEKQTNRGLFTTLDSVVGKLKIAPFSPSVLLSDTIGFIDHLPPFLINAFRSTLLESTEAQLLLHVVDSGDPERDHKIEVVEQILRDLKVTESPFLVFNKADTLSAKERQIIEETYALRPHFFISAKTGEGLGQIKELLKERFIVT